MTNIGKQLNYKRKQNTHTLEHAHINVTTLYFYRATACNATLGIATRKPSVRLSVKRVDCDIMKESSANILATH